MVDKSTCLNNPQEPREDLNVKLVEYNTIASSMGCFSQKVGQLQKNIMRKYEEELQVLYKFDRVESKYRENVAEKFKLAIESYCESTGRRKGDVLFVIEDEERMVLD